MKKLMCLVAAAILAVAVSDCSKQPLVITAPEPEVMSFPEATVFYGPVLKGTDGPSAALANENKLLVSADSSLEISSDEQQALFTKVEVFESVQSGLHESAVTSALIDLQPASRERVISENSGAFTFTLMTRHPIKMMAATEVALNILAENLVAIESAKTSCVIVCEGNGTYAISPAAVMQMKMYLADELANGFLKDGTLYLEFGPVLEAGRTVMQYLQARYGCLKDGNVFEAIERGQEMIEYLLAN
jgi:hypothetical protein